MKLSKGNRDLILHGSLVKAVFAIAIPVVVNSFLQTMYNCLLYTSDAADD